MLNYNQAKANMITNQVLPGCPEALAFIDTISQIPRELFVPKNYQDVAYIDSSIPLINGRFLMPVLVFARMLLLTKVTKEDNVLDLACGFGYSSAILANLSKKVFAIEPEPELASRANLALNKMHYDNIIVLSNPIHQGHKEGGPYDVIFINGAVEKVPEEILDQLSNNGRLVTIIKNSKYSGQITLIEKKQGKFLYTKSFDANMPLLKLEKAT